MTKVYDCGAFGPDLEKSDIVSYELGDADIQFCLPQDEESDQNFIAELDQVTEWLGTSGEPLEIARADWIYRIEEDGWNLFVGQVSFSIKLVDLDDLKNNFLPETTDYSILKPKDIGRLAVDYFKELVYREASGWDESIDHEGALELYDLHIDPESLPILRRDILPWFLNHRIREDVYPKRRAFTFVPVSDKTFLLVQYDFIRLKQGDEWFFATDEEAEKFEAILREEFFSYFKVTYKQETLDKIKEYSES